MYGCVKNNSIIFQCLSHLLDPLIVVVTTILLANVLGFNNGQLSTITHVFAVFGSVLVLLVFPFFKIYRSWRGNSIIEEIKVIFFAWIAVLLIFNAMILLITTGGQLNILRSLYLSGVKIFWIWSITVFISIILCRILLRFIFRFLRWRGFNQRCAIIIGAGKLGIDIADSIDSSSWLGINIVGFFDDRLAVGHMVKGSRGKEWPVLGSISDCVSYATKQDIDLAIIALPTRAEHKINNLIWNLGTNGTSVNLIPDLFIYGLQKANIQKLGDIPIMSFNLFPLWKRAFDVVFSLMVLIITSPFFLIIAILIKLDDGGPIFYGHKRIMESGKSFFCLKFRTMHVNADKYLKELLMSDPALREEWEVSFKLKNDPRITKIGGFLRKTSLDELPQFINVLKGEMSVVGARPIVSKELYKYYKQAAITYCAMKPGITGPWQIGKRSDTEDYEERVQLDKWYVLNASLSLDIKIIFQTIFKVISTKGAY